MNDDILDLCDKRRTLKSSRNDNEESRKKYREINNEIKIRKLEANETWIDKKCAKIEREMSKGNSKEAYNTIKELTKVEQPRTTAIEDTDGKLLTESAAVLGRLTQYCQDLYNHELKVDEEIIKEKSNDKPTDSESTQVLKEEVEEAIKSMKIGKSAGIDNIPAELIKYGGPEMINALTIICQRIWKSKEWPDEWTKSILIPLPKKGNLKKCQNYRTISLISHPSEVMLKIILQRLKQKSEEILSEEQAGFRAGRSTAEQIFNIRILIEKCLQHQQDLYHNFIDFKKAFDRVWHEGLWHVMRQYNFDEDLIQVIESLYKSAKSAVLLSGELGEYFLTTVGVRQGCILSPVLFNIFLENIMQDALKNYESKVSIGGRQLCNLRFADDIDLIGRTEKELQELTTRLEKSASAFGMEISSEKSKILVNSNTETKTTNIIMNGEILEEVKEFKYLGALINSKGTSVKEIKTRLAIALSSMAKLTKIWKNNGIKTGSKLKLYKTLVTSIASYGCESWTLTEDTQRRIQAFEMKCFRRILNISYKEHKTNDFVWNKVLSYDRKIEPLLSTIKRRKMKWFGHVTRHNSLSKTILQGTVEGRRKRGRQRKLWSDNIKQWTEMDLYSLLNLAQDREEWRKLCGSVSAGSPTLTARDR